VESGPRQICVEAHEATFDQAPPLRLGDSDEGVEATQRGFVAVGRGSSYVEQRVRLIGQGETPADRATSRPTSVCPARRTSTAS